MIHIKTKLLYIFDMILSKFVYRFINLIYELIHEDYIILSSSVYPLFHNWGDDISRKICEFINPNKKVIINNFSWNLKKKEEIMCVGSIISWMTTDKSIIWGSGVVYPDKAISAKPKKVCAVRGPLSRNYLINQGISCPEIYGDPALLLPRFYSPNYKKKYKLGIIPHFRDKNNDYLNYIKNNQSVLIIDVEDITPWHKFIDRICECEAIASSSLHGIIISDAYQIPNVWCEFPEGECKEFAFQDYMMSVGKKIRKPYVITKESTITDIKSNAKFIPIKIDLDLLIDVCPFKE